MNRDTKIDFILTNYGEMTGEQIADIVKLHPNTVRRIARENNITKRISFRRLYPDEELYNLEGFSRYMISTYGRFMRIQDNIEIQWCYTVDGYPTIKLVNDQGKRVILRVHRVVMDRFSIFRPSEIKSQTNHINGDKTYNHYTNLEWVTPSENVQHAIDTGLKKDFRSRKYNDDNIIEICELLNMGYSRREVLKRLSFEANLSLIKDVKTKKSWVWLSDNYF